MNKEKSKRLCAYRIVAIIDNVIILLWIINDKLIMIQWILKTYSYSEDDNVLIIESNPDDIEFVESRKRRGDDVNLSENKRHKVL